GVGRNTGLGLFLVRQILDLTDLTITENGAEGKGCRFEICAPSGMWRKGSQPMFDTPPSY
ncbi:MAG TPA: ATP-binding protein, partial [Methanospirillum sp.]|nr:ATP-binding protein [Methanospirillum sp.]